MEFLGCFMRNPFIKGQKYGQKDMLEKSYITYLSIFKLYVICLPIYGQFCGHFLKKSFIDQAYPHFFADGKYLRNQFMPVLAGMSG